MAIHMVADKEVAPQVKKRFGRSVGAYRTAIVAQADNVDEVVRFVESIGAKILQRRHA